MLDVLSIGNANIDIYPDNERFFGGSANNFAINCSKMGLKSGLLGFVGKDEAGKSLIKNLKINKVQSFLKKSDKKTGTVKILSQGFKKKFIKSKGANKDLKSLNIILYLKKANHIHFATPYIELLKQAPKGLSISIDSGSELSKYSIEKLKPYLGNALAFFANESEAQKITGKNWKLAVDEFIKAGAKIAIIKGAKDGIIAKSKDESIFLPYENQIPLDATGAGDAFASAFIYAIIKKKGLKEAMKLGMALSSLKLKKKGAQNLPSLSEFKKWPK